MKRIILTVAICFLFILNPDLFAQSIGKIFKKADADTIFGKVYFSKNIDSNLIQKMLSDTTNITMFKLTKDKLIILNKNKKPIYPDTISVNNDETFYLFTKDKLKELFDKSGNKSGANIEMRGSSLTITSGDITLEQAVICPPICF